ncbi:uncharacterized protein LOC132265840 [Phlebotomus argentipes]|uniref:uncharacterized protein LOC132265840 n=1 Tax=Phlebotomus argentipes TaxID=94469 RepID=UPI002892DC4E|nr:uncharacterized protein LOC132265840 [Phlebotomus argentipes]
MTKIQALQKLKLILQKTHPDANKDTVSKKINSLRTNFKAEYKKMRMLLASDDETTHYAPRSPHFHSLMFLANADRKISPKGGRISFVTMSPIRDAEDATSKIDDSLENAEGDTEDFPENCNSEVVKKEQARKRKLSDDISSDVFDDTAKTMDECEAFGRYVGMQMRVLDFEQRIFLKRLISEGIFRGEMRLLSANTKLSE